MEWEKGEGRYSMVLTNERKKKASKQKDVCRSKQSAERKMRCDARARAIKPGKQNTGTVWVYVS